MAVVGGRLGSSLTVGFRIPVPAAAPEVRDGLARWAVPPPEERRAGLEVLDSGPDRFASRLSVGGTSQLRVVGWTPPDRGIGAVEYSTDGRLRLVARFTVRVQADASGSIVGGTYALHALELGLGLSLRFARRRPLVRRLAAAWLPDPAAIDWRRLEVLPHPEPWAAPSRGAEVA